MISKTAIFIAALFFCSYWCVGQNPIKIIRDLDLAGSSQTWFADTTYLLDGYVFLESGGSLAIEAGTLIKARRTPSGTDPTSALIIAQGAVLFAQGEYMNPIIFTAEDDDITNAYDLSSEDRGLWGGIVILGSAPVINNLGEEITMRHPAFGAEESRAQFGGNGINSSAGVLSNVSIRFAGASAPNGAFAGLSLAGAGRGIRVDSVEVFASGGDGFEFIGGIIDTRNLSSSFCGDDCFDWDLGFSGRGQFWFGLQGSDVADCAMEGRGKFSNPIIYNPTMIGSGQGSRANNPVAIRLFEGSGLNLGMGVIADFPNKGLQVEDLPGDDDSYAKLTTGQISFKSNIWSDFGSGLNFEVDEGLVMVSNEAEDPSATDLNLHLADSNYLEIGYLPYLSRRKDRFLYPDERLDIFDLEYPYSYPQDSFFIQDLDYPCYGHGAFLTNGAWWLRYWTALDQDDYLMHPCAIDFYTDPRLNFLGPDTIIIDCETLEALDFEYECFNSKCFFGNQGLALAMRSKRKKQGAMGGMNPPHCYIQELEIAGIESQLIFGEGIFVLDTFTLRLTALVVDNTPPEIILQGCDTCQIPVEVFSQDCDTSWVQGPEILVIDDTITKYIWTAFDRCDNMSTLALNWNIQEDLQAWFQDQDGDGFGGDVSLLWRGDVTGYSNVSGDCHDQDSTIYPGAPENSTDNFDNDCSGSGNIEICEVSDELAVSPDCTPENYMLNATGLEVNSSSNSCLEIFPFFHGDIWFSCIVTSAAAINVELVADFSTSLNLYRGTCLTLDPLECALFDSGLEAKDLVPGETIYIQVVVDNQVSGPFSICASAPNVTSTSDIEGIHPFSVFPNPSQGLLKLRINDLDIKAGYLGIYSILGQRMKIIDFQANKFENYTMDLDISDLPSGSYWVVLQNSKNKWVSRVVKI